jgi:spore germination cell wall hydrolase CwlJ-like protein
VLEWRVNALILLLALHLSGECGSVGHGCEFAVARTMANRLGSPGFPTTVEGMLEAYYAVAEEPTPDALREARLFLTDPDVLRDERYFYAYSNADRRTQGWGPGDEVICGPGGLCVNLAKEFPGG